MCWSKSRASDPKGRRGAVGSAARAVNMTEQAFIHIVGTTNNKQEPRTDPPYCYGVASMRSTWRRVEVEDCERKNAEGVKITSKRFPECSWETTIVFSVLSRTEQ